MKSKVLVGALALAVVATGVSPVVAEASGGNALDAVNTFIGTQDEGNTFPGASAPFGMTQVSPITSHYAGYRYTDTAIRGFGHFFLSGAGCWETVSRSTAVSTEWSPQPGHHRAVAPS